MTARDGVVLLHGLGRGRRSMAGIARAARHAGYATLNVGYPSRRLDLAGLAGHVAPAIGEFADSVERLHFITHSMGGLVARAYVTRHRPPRLGRVVMLAPPNQGSELADRLAPSRIFRRLLGPAAGQLVPRRDPELAALLGEIDFELGVIAAKRSMYPLASRLLPAMNDGRVSLAATRVDGMAAHLTVPATHPTIVWNRTAVRATIHFLQHGRFSDVIGHLGFPEIA